MQDKPLEVQRDIDDGFIITDPDTGHQRCKRLDDGMFHFKTGFDGYKAHVDDITLDLNLTEAVIDLTQYSGRQQERYVSSYYDSIAELKSICDNDIDSVNLLIAEAIYETDFELA